MENVDSDDDYVKVEYPYPFESVKQVLCEYQNLVELVQSHPEAELEPVLMNAGKEVAEYLTYANQVVQGPQKESARYWLTQGQGSLLLEGLKKLQYSMEFVINCQQ